MRLTIDSGAVADGNANPAQRILDVDATHGDDLPKGLRIVNRAATYAHNDPNSAAPRKNQFLKFLVPYLKRVAAT
jgi:hypothetical protein